MIKSPEKVRLVIRECHRSKLLALFLIAGCKSAEEEYDYDDEPAPPPVTPAPTRPAGRLGSLLSPRGRNPVGRKPSP
ncbi:hypothetical protein PV326_012344, partial [Microctonus aethiopoides]